MILMDTTAWSFGIEDPEVAEMITGFFGSITLDTPMGQVPESPETLLIAAATFSYFQPYGRYTYRSLVHTIANASLSAAVREGTFIQHEGRTFLVEGATADGTQLRKVFVYEENDDGGAHVTTANTGSLR